VDDVDLAPGCTPEVELAAIPPLPAVVGVSQPLCFEVPCAPRDEGADTCQVVVSTGGAFMSFCEADLAPLFDGIEAEVFGLPVQFYLSEAPVPGTVRVTVEGAPCESGWVFDALTNSVIFDPDGPCSPQPGIEFVVSYAVACAG